MLCTVAIRWQWITVIRAEDSLSMNAWWLLQNVTVLLLFFFKMLLDNLPALYGRNSVIEICIFVTFKLQNNKIHLKIFILFYQCNITSCNPYFVVGQETAHHCSAASCWCCRQFSQRCSNHQHWGCEWCMCCNVQLWEKSLLKNTLYFTYLCFYCCLLANILP